jgi:hypothetical protein
MAHDMLFRGVAPALVTPFTSDDDIDEAAFRRLIDAQIEGGVSALVVLGTTGENPTITEDERRRIVDAALDAADGRVPVIVGTGTNNTDESVAFSKAAVDAGADGLLVVGPYYNKPSQAGFAAHVETIAAAAEAPIILYNVPGRTSFNIAPETALHLAEEVPHVAGIKEASGDIEQIDDLLAHRPDGFGVYSPCSPWAGTGRFPSSATPCRGPSANSWRPGSTTTWRRPATGTPSCSRPCGPASWRRTRCPSRTSAPRSAGWSRTCACPSRRWTSAPPSASACCRRSTT